MLASMDEKQKQMLQGQNAKIEEIDGNILLQKILNMNQQR